MTYNQVHPLQINYLASNHKGKIISAQHKDVSVLMVVTVLHHIDYQIMSARI